MMLADQSRIETSQSYQPAKLLHSVGSRGESRISSKGTAYGERGARAYIVSLRALPSVGSRGKASDGKFPEIFTGGNFPESFRKLSL
jgi:hypothetical protein